MRNKNYILISFLVLLSNLLKAEGVGDWQLGFGLGVEQFRDEYIESASLRGDDRIVTIEEDYKTKPSAWLTMNWNFWGLKERKDANGAKVQVAGNDVFDTKFGLFAGVKLLDGQESMFSSFALGPQVTFVTGERVISVGLGWVTHQTRRFADGIEESKPLPEQYDDIVYRRSSENSYMLMMAVQF